jgi:hypothetical protein
VEAVRGCSSAVWHCMSPEEQLASVAVVSLLALPGDVLSYITMVKFPCVSF